jgi:hypothetical protein
LRNGIRSWKGQFLLRFQIALDHRDPFSPYIV